MNIKTIGITLIVIGAIMVIYTGFNYVTTEKIVDIGPIEVNGDKNHSVQWSPYLGAVLLIAGLAITILKNKTN